MRAYNQLRRAAVYLRWDEGDADTFVPSLYAGKKRATEAATAPLSATPEQAAPTPVTTEPTNITPAVAESMPNSDPFVSAN